ncbi:hypothetical protein A676_03279 [Salmonella enterica subsp. enterica serovar Enteritidis str. 2010K-0262]|uniref:Uncharacterized protein n=2 Tax=Salmonella enterica I TaxID=59201 RepID=M7RFN0_SALDU|nr:hypothetical protein A670_04239 [Salmonella enterica subsp. enterica serovar Dublin str. UC16]EPI69732.1 hypothetical protein A672_03316 [Salmonella enterica subsp. enterica serovar Enteritidis str. 08-1080]EPI71894.1 hypothetical protein A673_01518 [Salmonella enterica subsp. enterica serovar Enteritidis str. 2009K0958]EPI72709.1 hypothetical protein A671_01461 [Salmonella enterica subsp. enterica serovar Dublin str. DG22]EPI80843.1 hypothetical protein A676_03279 [Salmonella enterica subsp
MMIFSGNKSIYSYPCSAMIKRLLFYKSTELDLSSISYHRKIYT